LEENLHRLSNPGGSPDKIGFPTQQEVLQTRYMSAVPEERLLPSTFLIIEDKIISGQKAFCIGMLYCFFLCFRVDMNRTMESMEKFARLGCQSLTQQTWFICAKLFRVIVEALNMKSLNTAYKRHKMIDFAEWEWINFSQCFAVPLVKKGDCDNSR
jgi:hypothetical protein